MKVQELLKVPSPENYPLILKYLSAPVAVEKELVDPMFYGVLHSTTRVFSRVLGTLMAWNVRMLCVSTRELWRIGLRHMALLIRDKEKLDTLLAQ